MNPQKSIQFLRYLQELRRDRFSFESKTHFDSEFKEIINKKEEQVFLTPEFSNEEDYHHAERIIQSNIRKITEGLPQVLKSQFEGKVSIGGAALKNINAIIVKNPIDEVYAILVNYGLVLYLSKYFSYVFAATDFEAILWCENPPLEKLRPIDIIKFTDTLSKNYLEKGLPLGPNLLLKKSLAEDISIFVDLSIQYVICHELAHFLNGDCDQSSYFAPHGLVNRELVLEEEQNHEIEYQADLKGFDLLHSLHPNMELNLYALFLFYIAFDWLFQKPINDSHPNPAERFKSILRQKYNEEEANKFEKFLKAFTIGNQS